jgi:hypothetical protein
MTVMAKKNAPLSLLQPRHASGLPPVEPPDERSALKEAVREFNIEDVERQKGLMTVREGERRFSP